MNDEMRTDEYSIIKQCLGGDQEKYAILVERYQGMIHNLSYRMLGDAEAAKDVAQESFVSAYVALRNFQGGAKFSSWLCRIAMNKCRDYLRSKKGTLSVDVIAELSATKEACPEEAASKKQIRDGIQAALSSLPEDYREVIILKHIEGLDYREMEKILGISANILKVRTYRGREMLKKILTGKEEATR